VPSIFETIHIDYHDDNYNNDDEYDDVDDDHDDVNGYQIYC